jgi:hypothetical protein
MCCTGVPMVGPAQDRLRVLVRILGHTAGNNLTHKARVLTTHHLQFIRPIYLQLSSIGIQNNIPPRTKRIFLLQKKTFQVQGITNRET